ncbi:MAG: hypothetical protein UHK60_00780 [Acutalibacteraceae bacterium]|nr:hypothetical protein [Acutalibacteraceae bacterium]
MSNINSLDREAKEYFYSLPLATQDIIKASNLEITCREDIQRYFTNVINPTHTPIFTNKSEG